MQLLIDTNDESSEGLLAAANTLIAIINSVGTLGVVFEIAVARPIKTPAAPPIGKPTPVTPVAPPPSADVPAGTEELDPAKVFGRPLAAMPAAPVAAPPPPSVPPAPMMTQDGALPATMTAAASAAPPPPPTSAVMAPVVPAASTVTLVSNTAAGADPSMALAERDSANIPWDARVHSETKKKNADGTWRFRRGLDESVKTAVMADLRNGIAPVTPATLILGPSTSTVIAAPPPPVTPATAQTLNFTPSEVATLTGAAPPPPPPGATGTDRIPELAPAPPPPPTAQVAPPPPAASVSVPPPPNVGVPDTYQPGLLPPVTNFRDLMKKVNMALAHGKLTHPVLAEACKDAGVDGIAALAAQPMLVPKVDAYINRMLVAA